MTATKISAFALAALVLAAAGCGVHQGPGTSQAGHRTAQQPDPLAGLTAKQIDTKVISEMKSAPAFTLAGEGKSQGEKAVLSFAFSGDGCSFSFDIGSKGSETILVIGKNVWMKADAAFWKSAGAQAGGMGATFAGKYVKLPADGAQAFSRGMAGCDRKQMLSTYAAASSVPKDLVKGAKTTVDGQQVYTLTSKSQGTTMYVTDVSAPRMIEVVESKSATSGQFTISYGIPKSIAAPPASESVSMP